MLPGYTIATVLAAKGRLVFCGATGHRDGNVFRQTRADMLVWMWRSYEAI